MGKVLLVVFPERFDQLRKQLRFLFGSNEWGYTRVHLKISCFHFWILMCWWITFFEKLVWTFSPTSLSNSGISNGLWLEKIGHWHPLHLLPIFQLLFMGTHVSVKGPSCWAYSYHSHCGGLLVHDLLAGYFVLWRKEGFGAPKLWMLSWEESLSVPTCFLMDGTWRKTKNSLLAVFSLLRNWEGTGYGTNSYGTFLHHGRHWQIYATVVTAKPDQ